MSTDLSFAPAPELEEMLEHSIPCGGNVSPALHPCPHRSKAVMRRVAICACGDQGPTRPTSYKCLTCWTEWLINAERRAAQGHPVRCPKCKTAFVVPPINMYARF